MNSLYNVTNMPIHCKEFSNISKDVLIPLNHFWSCLLFTEQLHHVCVRDPWKTAILNVNNSSFRLQIIKVENITNFQKLSDLRFITIHGNLKLGTVFKILYIKWRRSYQSKRLSEPQMQTNVDYWELCCYFYYLLGIIKTWGGRSLKRNSNLSLAILALIKSVQQCCPALLARFARRR